MKEIKQIRDNLPEDIDIECFVHGAMCISYSGRCLLSNYITGRDSNKGQCAQICRWKFKLINPGAEQDQEYPIEEDERGTYILNSKDLCLVEYIKELAEAGITSLKVEGRMKSNYYVGNVINCYRRAIDNYYSNKLPDFNYVEELKKCSSRDFTTGFYFSSDQKTNIKSSTLTQTYDYTASVIEDMKDNKVLIEQRNKFVVGDTLQVLSPYDTFNKEIKIEKIVSEKGENIDVANRVQQKLYIFTSLPLKKNDILRKKIDNDKIKG